MVRVTPLSGSVIVVAVPPRPRSHTCQISSPLHISLVQELDQVALDFTWPSVGGVRQAAISMPASSGGPGSSARHGAAIWNHDTSDKNGHFGTYKYVLVHTSI